MARYICTVRPCKLADRPNFKWVLNFYHPTVGRRRTYFETREKAEAERTAKEIEAANFGIQAASLTVEQMRRLLVATKADPDIFATVALGGFAGLRPPSCAASPQIGE